MPLSKRRNRDRMRKSRLHKHLSPLREMKPVQPRPMDIELPNERYWTAERDADGNPIPDVG